MRTRSSRRHEDAAEPEQLPELANISTRRRGRKTAGKAPQTKPITEEEGESATQQVAAALSLEVPTVPSTSGPGQYSPPAQGDMHLAAAASDEAQEASINSDAELDFLAEGTKLAEALLQTPEVGDPASSPSGVKDEKPESSQQLDVGHLVLPAGADGVGQEADIRAASDFQEGACAASFQCPTGLPGSAAYAAAIRDRQADEQEAVPGDGKETNKSHSAFQLPSLLQPFQAVGEEQHAAYGCPEDVQDTEEQSKPASSHRPIDSLQTTTSNALHARRSMRSGSLDAYERGRKSGIWQGATSVSMGDLEKEWDSYKATSLRGWTMPSLQDAQVKSQALASSGFTMVSYPKISATSRSKLQADKPVRAENKRKASFNVQESTAAPRKVPKVRDTPSKVQVPAKGRAWAASPSRFRNNASSSRPGTKGNNTTRNTDFARGSAPKPLGEKIPRPQKAS